MSKEHSDLPIMWRRLKDRPMWNNLNNHPMWSRPWGPLYRIDFQDSPSFLVRVIHRLINKTFSNNR
jgi:hypothetical protein